MPTNSLSTSKPIPGVPVSTESSVPEAFRDTWILYYLMGGNPGVLFTCFHLKGGLQDAMDRAAEYCRIMGYRRLYIRPLFSDMDHDENVRLNRDRRD